MAATWGERERTLELMNDELNGRIGRQAASGNAIDTKAALLLGFVALAAQLLISQQRQTAWASGAFVFYALAFGLGLWCVWLRTYKAVPKPEAMKMTYDRILAAGVRNLREQMLATLVATKAGEIHANARKDHVRARLWWLMLIA